MDREVIPQDFARSGWRHRTVIGVRLQGQGVLFEITRRTVEN